MARRRRDISSLASSFSSVIREQPQVAEEADFAAGGVRVGGGDGHDLDEVADAAGVMPAATALSKKYSHSQ